MVRFPTPPSASRRLAYGLRFTASLSALVLYGGLLPNQAGATGLELPCMLPFAMQRPAPNAGRPLRAFMSPAVAASGEKRFFSDANNGAVLIYDTASTLVGTVTGFGSPEGLATDKAGRLYVVEQYNSQVDVFAPPYNGTPTYLLDRGQSPVATAVDSAGNGLIAIEDELQRTIYSYKPPHGGALGSPVSTTVLQSTMDPVTFAFGPRAGVVVTVDADLALTNQYTFPAGGAHRNHHVSAERLSIRSRGRRNPNGVLLRAPLTFSVRDSEHGRHHRGLATRQTAVPTPHAPDQCPRSFNGTTSSGGHPPSSLPSPQ